MRSSYACRALRFALANAVAPDCAQPPSYMRQLVLYIQAAVCCRFMEPVDAKAEMRSLNDAETVGQTYATVRERVNEGMSSLLQERNQDPLRSLQARVRQAVTQNAPAFELLRGVLPSGRA